MITDAASAAFFIYLDGFTPITAVDEALHFNPHTRQFEPD